ncbi:EboA domain-containing protein [Streptomyces sp. Y7]|uniref:EboA domain-containing protein n=1 Tax=Streptomyces sp. Y7 TaxID=3342392 RepID=UPI00371EF20D
MTPTRDHELRHQPTQSPPPGTPAELETLLPEHAAAWLTGARAQLREDADTVDGLFAVAARRCGRDAAAGANAAGWTVDDAVRALLLASLPLRGAELATVVTRLYQVGGAAERRAVLRALPLLERSADLGDRALPLVEDALRTNDLRLIAAAVGPYGARHLDAHSFRHAVLKCVFVGIPLAGVSGLADRADTELTRMMADFATERRAAARPVPPDVLAFLDTHPAPTEAST